MATRSSANARNEVLELLKADHKKVKQVFRKFDGMDIEDDLEAARAMVLQACDDLEVHATLEEELFYPAVRGVIKDTMVVAEAEVEHGGAKMLIAELRTLDPSDEAFAASFIVLGEYVKHHIREEENEMFEQLARTRIDWEALRDSMLERRTALIAEREAAAPQDGAPGAGDDSAEPAEGGEAAAAQGEGGSRSKPAGRRQGSRSARTP